MNKNTYKGKRIQMLGGVVVDDSTGEELGFLDKNGSEVYIPDTMEPTVLRWRLNNKGDLNE